MELKSVLLTLLKIVISTHLVGCASVLMGGHVTNHNHSEYEEYDYADSLEDSKIVNDRRAQEKIPNPSPLVVPGYNLPETIFNSGKPFYAEKDPLTGKIDLDHKTPTLKSTDYEYQYDDEVPSDDIYNKKNIDRKDGAAYGSSSHKQTDINQLTPNFHDFLNLPVKYNPEKYVYPLISSSYASTKIQGSVNKYHNHKDTFGVQKTSTVKPYYSTTQNYRTTQRTMATTPVSTTTTTTRPTSTIRWYPDLTTTTTTQNLLSSGMSHPSFTDEYDDYQETTQRSTTTPSTSNKETTTTKRALTLLEQLFGDYDVTVTTTEAATTHTYTNIHAGPHKLDYSEEDYIEDYTTIPKSDDHLSVEPLKPVTKLTPINTTTSTTTTTTTTTTRAPPTTYRPPTTPRVTSLPLGENHIISQPTINRDPIIVATQNLREKLNSEKVPQVLMHPSSTNIHIAPGQDTVSFVVGQHQSVGDVGHRPQNDPYIKPEVEVTIQPMQNSETSLAIGNPINRLNKVPGQVMDASLEENHFSKTATGNKVVFPSEKPVQSNLIPSPNSNGEVLQLNSKPMYHQLPSDLTPPKETQMGGFRPPWHFKPPRPHPEMAYKRIDNLPNILPQFRPNMNKKHHPVPYYYDKRFNRQPLLERPSNRPVNYYPPHPNVYKRYPPPPPPPRNILRGNLDLEERRPLAQQPPQSLDDTPMAEDRIINEDPRRDPELDVYQTPPNMVPNRRQGEGEVETLQMIQAKNDNKEEQGISKVAAQEPQKTMDKTIYKVYPVNTQEPNQSVKDDNNDFNYKQQDRNDAPILKPHPRPVAPPGKGGDFPYHLERPTPPTLGTNQWNTIRDDPTNQIAVTLRTYTEKPIAIAYTPTEPHPLNGDRYSMPNYGSPVIPEIRPGSMTYANLPPPPPPPINNQQRIDSDIMITPKLDFQAPFQASVKLDANITNQGWAVVDRNNTATLDEETEVTTLPWATTSEFDIENFKPQLIGGFTPLYTMPMAEVLEVKMGVADREEK